MMRFISHGPSVFEGSDITMEKVLDDDYVEYSLSSPNEKCREFFTIQRIEELIKYITEMPTDENDKKKSFKPQLPRGAKLSRYPFTAATILSSKSPIITEYFFSKGGKKSFEDDLFEQFEAEVLLIEDDKDEENKNKSSEGYNEERLNKFFAFLAIDDEINDVLAGYFQKVVNSFFDGKYKQMILEYFFTGSQQHSDNLIKHIYCRSVSELLTKFLNFSAIEIEESPKNSFSYGGGGRMMDFRQTITSGDRFSSLTNGGDDQDGEELEFESEEKKKAKEELAKLNETMLGLRVQLFKELANRLLMSTDYHVIGNIRSIFEHFLENYKDVDQFCDIFRKLFFDGDGVLEVLFSCLISRGTKKQRKVSEISTLITHILDFLAPARKQEEKKKEQEFGFRATMRFNTEDKADDKPSEFDELKPSKTMIDTIIQQVPVLVGLLEEEFEEVVRHRTSTFGQDCRHLGVKSLAIVSLFRAFLALEEQEIVDCVAGTEFLRLAMTLFKEFGWNNAYHNEFIKIFGYYLKQDAESALYKRLVEDNRLAIFLLDLHKNSDVTTKNGKVTIKIGYYGYLREIGNKVLELEDSVKKDPIVNSEAWKEFDELHLKPVNELLSKDRDDVFKNPKKKDSWLENEDLETLDIMEELNSGGLQSKILGMNNRYGTDLDDLDDESENSEALNNDDDIWNNIVFKDTKNYEDEEKDAEETPAEENGVLEVETEATEPEKAANEAQDPEGSGEGYSAAKAYTSSKKVSDQVLDQLLDEIQS